MKNPLDLMPASALAGATDGETSLRSLITRARERLRARARRASTPALSISPVGAPEPSPPLSPPGPVRLRLTNGRSLALDAPPLAGRQDVAALGAANERNTSRAFAALHEHERAIAALQRSQRELGETLERLQRQSDVTLLESMRSVGRVRRRVQRSERLQARARAVEQRVARTAASRQARAFRAQSSALTLQQVNAAVSSAQVAAFGEAGDLLATNNLLLVANQLFWSLVDPLLRGLGLWSEPEPSPLAKIGPLGNLATGALLLGSRNQPRFISGTTELTETTGGDGDDGRTLMADVDLRDRVAKANLDDFERGINVSVTASVVKGAAFTTLTEAVVRNGILHLEASRFDGNASVQVAWIVDTGAGNA